MFALSSFSRQVLSYYNDSNWIRSGGMEWWNGLLEWNTGMEYWNAHLLYCAVLKSTVAERTSTARRTIVHNIMLLSHRAVASLRQRRRLPPLIWRCKSTLADLFILALCSQAIYS